MALLLDPYDTLFESGIFYVKKLVQSRPVDRPRELISEYAADKRVLPPETPFPGPWDNRRTPYLVEIMDQMAPYSPAHHVRFMKCAQVGATAAAENIMAYWMDENPAPIMVTSATEETIKEWMELRAEQVIDSCGFRHKIVANINNPKSRRTGDKSMLKEYVGGFLTVASAQAAARLRSKSIRIMLRDEIDGSPEQLKTGEGNWIDVSEARLDAWGARSKIFDFSTPTMYHASTIYKLHQAGDRRVFTVPCPYCGRKQELKLGDENTQYGLKPIRKAGKVIDVVYSCEACHEAIHNYHKSEMLAAGNWEITAPFEDKLNPSYYISGLYSPVGMVSWLKLWKRYEKAQDDPEAMRSFMNLSLGLPFKESGDKPAHRELIKLRGGYSAGTVVPSGVLYLVAGVDVQGGSKKRKKENPPRLELEVMGMGALRQTWSLDYKVFKGAVDDPSEGAWKLLKEYIDSFHADRGEPYKDEYGLPFKIELCLIDSGDGNYTSVVYSFTQMMRNVHPSKGASRPIQRKRTDPILDIASYARDKPYERKIFKENNVVLYRINTAHYKSQLYKHLRLSRQKGLGEHGWGYCDFPRDYPDRYFRMLVAEERREDGSFFCPAGRRNESLDCRVMCLCAADAYLDYMTERTQQYMIDSKQAIIVDHAYMIREFKNRVRVQRELLTKNVVLADTT